MPVRSDSIPANQWVPDRHTVQQALARYVAAHQGGTAAAAAVIERYLGNPHPDRTAMAGAGRRAP